VCPSSWRPPVAWAQLLPRGFAEGVLLAVQRAREARNVRSAGSALSARWTPRYDLDVNEIRGLIDRHLAAARGVTA
jgi:hypothetical protein